MTSDPKTPAGHNSLTDAEKSAMFLEGIRLFNSKQFFLCHEKLEELWMHEPRPIRVFYQSIIQLATAYYHLTRQNFTGAVNLIEAAMQKLHGFEPETLGINVTLLIEKAEISRLYIAELGEEMVNYYDIHVIPQIESRSK